MGPSSAMQTCCPLLGELGAAGRRGVDNPGNYDVPRDLLLMLQLVASCGNSGRSERKWEIDAKSSGSESDNI
jgi:hypothetical protein